jgi:hypothetical protein
LGVEQIGHVGGVSTAFAAKIPRRDAPITLPESHAPSNERLAIDPSDASFDCAVSFVASVPWVQEEGVHLQCRSYERGFESSKQV